MAYVVAALAGVVGLGLGWIVAAFAALAIGALIGVSDFEGQRAMVAFFAIGPVGGLIGLVIGVWASRKLKIGRRPTLLTLLIAVALVILAVHGNPAPAEHDRRLVLSRRALVRAPSTANSHRPRRIVRLRS